MNINSLEGLPPDAQIEILQKCDIPDVERIGQAGRNWKKLANNDRVWRGIADKIGCPFDTKGLDIGIVRNKVQEYCQGLKDRASNIKPRPGYIDNIIKDQVTIENTRKLSEWIKARDTIIFWREVLDRVPFFRLEKPEIPDIMKLKGVEDTAKAANDITAWFQENKESLADLELNLVHLDGKCLSSFPDEIGELSGIKMIYAENNQLIELPDSFGKLTNVRELLIENNKLESLPKSIGNLKSLGILQLKNNKIESLPESIGNLKKLYDLDLSNNHVSKLPESIGKLYKLTSLDVSNNKLEKLPIEKIMNLTQLNSLRLKDSGIKMDEMERYNKYFFELKDRGVHIFT